MKELHRSAKQDKITGGATSITSSNLTASRALVSDGSGKVAASSVTSTELGHLSGVTSKIQTQINAKAAASDLTSHIGDTTKHITATERSTWNAKQNAITGAASTITDANLTTSMVMITGDDGKAAASDKITVRELNMLNNVTSNVQTQIDNINTRVNSINAGIYPSFNTSQTLEYDTTFIPTVNGLLHYMTTSDARSGGYSMYITIGSATFQIKADDYSYDTGFIPVAAGTVIKYTYDGTDYKPGYVKFYPCA